jgi:TolA-binding protein
MTCRFPILPVLLTLGFLAPLAPAQEALEVEADIEFAQGLARRWQFVDLAEEVLDSISENHKLTPDQKENLDLVRCEVFGTAAKRERDPDERGRLYDLAIQNYQDFIAEHEYSELKPAAEGSLVQLSNSYASTLEMQLADLVGEEATAMRDKIRKLLEGPLTRTGSLVADISGIVDPTEQQKREQATLMLDRGRMLATMGRVSEDGTFYFGQAEAVLEDLSFLFGQRSGFGLQAYLEMARVKGDQGLWEDAVDFYQYVVDTVMPPDPKVWEDWSRELTQADKEQYWLFTELSIPGMLDAAINSGDRATATTYALLFWNRYKSEGFSLSLPRGYMALLACARTMLDVGGYVGGRTAGGSLQWFATQDEMAKKVPTKRNQRTAVDMSLIMAQTVNEDNKGNTLQTRAQKLISEIIERPGVVLGPEMLFEAADGQYKDKNYEKAILGCKRVLAALEGQDEASRSEFGPKVLNKLGNSYANLNRYLEATMVFREAVTTWGGDPEFDNRNAKGMLAALKFLKRTTNGDPTIQSLYLEAENHVTRTDKKGDTGDIVFGQAMRLYEAKDFDGAFDKLGAIEPKSDSYELAFVRRGACRYKQKRYDEAATIFKAYLEDYLGDAKNQTTSETRLARRLEARSLATFYLGSIAYKQHEWTDVVKYFAGFPKEFPSQSQMAPNALYMAVQAELQLKKVDEARALLAVLLADHPDHKYTGSSARLIYIELKKTLDAVAEGTPERTQLLEALADLISTSDRISPKPAYKDLRYEAGHWIELERWAEAETALRQTVKFYADSKNTTERKGYYKNVLPDLGKVLIAEGKLPDAVEVLRPLIPPVKTPEGESPPEFRPTSATVHNFFKAAVGWVEGDSANTITEVLGVGTPEDAKLAADWMDSLSRSSKVQNYTPEWYEIKFDLIFAWRRMGQSDSSKLDAARRQLKTMQTDCGKGFEGVAEDFAKAGKSGDALRQQYLWLSSELN